MLIAESENDMNLSGDHIVNIQVCTRDEALYIFTPTFFFVSRPHPTLKASYNWLEEKDKRILMSEKVIKDTLYAFRKSCTVDHPSCSMILYLDD